MPIACGNCGGAHETVSEVRACHQVTPSARGDVPEPDDDSYGWIDTSSDSVPARANRPGRSSDRPAPPAPDRPGRSPDRPGRSSERPAPPSPEAPAPAAPVHAGPAALGRSLVVRPGQDAPADWAACPRVVLDDEALRDPAAVIDQLAGWWTARRPYVVELAATLDRHPAETDDREPWRLDPSFTFPLDRLVHLVWSNALDLRDGGVPTNEAVTAAVAAGTTIAPEGTADVRTASGEPAWCDGGPLNLDLDLGGAAADGLPVLHRTWLEHGRVTPLANPAPTADLAADQLAAVTHRGGPCRVISPAGSGKTRTLTERARHLVAGCGLPPTALTLVAYNTRAAGEMRERLGELPGLQIRTLNSLGLAIVGGTGPFRRPGARPPRVLDEREVRDHLERLVKFPRRANTDPAALWIEALGQVRLGLRDPTEVEADYQGDVDGLADVFPRYREALRRDGAVDFDEQIYQAVEVLLREPETRRAAQRTSRVMLVDEFQDLTPAHLLLIRLLSAPAHDVFGVGDDDQTIYGYQGADPRWLIDFADYFPGAASHPLTVNYRCPPAAIDAARNLLTRNARRVPKTVEPAPGRVDEQGALQVVTTADGTVGATVDAVRAQLDAGAAPSDVVVLARVNAALAPVQVALAVGGIPVDPVPGIRAWLQRTGVRAALAWLDLALDPRRLSGAAIREAARRPPRGLSPKLIDWMSEQRDQGGLERLAGRVSRERDQEKLLAFLADLRLVAGVVAGGGDTAAVMATVRDRIGLGGAVESLDRSRGRVDRSTHGDDFDALHQLATLHPDPRTFRRWLTDQLNTEVPAGEGGRVHLSTVHRVKGLEWPHVVVHEVSDRLFPHRLVVGLDGREEERRIFHVALTRCSASVTVVAPADAPSPFLGELAAPGEPPPRPAPTPAPSRPTAGGKPSGPKEPAEPIDPAAWKQSHALHEALRQWRKARSTADGVPAFVVFADRTLDDLVARRPTTFPELLACHGIGPAKVENYGDELLAVIAEFSD
ncbi:MAG: ATP-dependent DNA helicase UvrD2 [Acidimicrobiales bacterium]|nr:ATP-dependent DNA helicase UvrD2 [Acidimicrobiales bacterium]